MTFFLQKSDAKAGHAGENGWPVPGQIFVPGTVIN